MCLNVTWETILLINYSLDAYLLHFWLDAYLLHFWVTVQHRALWSSREHRACFIIGYRLIISNLQHDAECQRVESTFCCHILKKFMNINYQEKGVCANPLCMALWHTSNLSHIHTNNWYALPSTCDHTHSSRGTAHLLQLSIIVIREIFVWENFVQKIFVLKYFRGQPLPTKIF